MLSHLYYCCTWYEFFWSLVDWRQQLLQKMSAVKENRSSACLPSEHSARGKTCASSHLCWEGTALADSFMGKQLVRFPLPHAKPQTAQPPSSRGVRRELTNAIAPSPPLHEVVNTAMNNLAARPLGSLASPLGTSYLEVMRGHVI